MKKKRYLSPALSAMPDVLAALTGKPRSLFEKGKIRLSPLTEPPQTLAIQSGRCALASIPLAPLGHGEFAEKLVSEGLIPLSWLEDNARYFEVQCPSCHPKVSSMGPFVIDARHDCRWCRDAGHTISGRFPWNLPYLATLAGDARAVATVEELALDGANRIKPLKPGQEPRKVVWRIERRQTALNLPHALEEILRKLLGRSAAFRRYSFAGVVSIFEGSRPLREECLGTTHPRPLEPWLSVLDHGYVVEKMDHLFVYLIAPSIGT